MSDGKRKPSFWETIPGIIAAIGTLLAGIGTLITALYAAGIMGPIKSKISPPKAKVPAVQSGTARQSTPPAIKKETFPPAKPTQGDIMIDSLTGMKFVYVPESCFMMGADDGDDDEKPVHKVCVNAFRMGKYEVTQGQWRKIIGTNPSHFQKGDSYPVEQVSWDDSQDFIKKLNSKTGKRYRLPTEAEWEYACRANSTGKYCGGDNLDDLAWYRNNSNKAPHPVGKKQANNFGLYDMSGNISEWCSDWYDADYYSASPQDSPTGPALGTRRVLRGGRWFFFPVTCRSVHRDRRHPGFRDDDIGFRLVLPIQ